jgi:hypothetical protein
MSKDKTTDYRGFFFPGIEGTSGKLWLRTGLEDQQK